VFASRENTLRLSYEYKRQQLDTVVEITVYSLNTLCGQTADFLMLQWTTLGPIWAAPVRGDDMETPGTFSRPKSTSVPHQSRVCRSTDAWRELTRHVSTDHCCLIWMATAVGGDMPKVHAPPFPKAIFSSMVSRRLDSLKFFTNVVFWDVT
jgi:hypothetical protein